MDNVHEPDGGCDQFGLRQGSGVEEMQKHMSALYERQGMPEAWDDVNNVFLEPAKVVDARAEEMRFFKKLGVYRRVPRALIKELGGKLISVRWLDTNKGDRDEPNYRSRLVGREYNEGRDDTICIDPATRSATNGDLACFHGWLKEAWPTKGTYDK